MGPQSIPLSLPLMLLWWIYVYTQLATAQVIENGRLYTNGLAIVDAPTQYSNYQVGSTMSIAIDVSGNGILSESAQGPGSSLPTRFDGLQIFLISDYSEFNMTIADASTILYQDNGSNVKYQAWVVPLCTPSGNYNVTLYESSVIDYEAYYTITTILIYITGSSAGKCSGLNLFQDVQLSSPFPQSPWLTSMCLTCSYSPTSIIGQTTTVLPQQSTMTVSLTTEVEVSTNNITYIGYIPVNAAKHLWMSAVATLMAGSLTMMTILTLLL